MSFITILALVFSCDILAFWQVEAASGDTRQVTLTLNPSCNLSECNNASVNLIYARAEGSNDTLHYILSTVGPSSPTLLLLKSERDATLNIDWRNFVQLPAKNTSGSIDLVSKKHGGVIEAETESVIVFDRLLEYNDSKDDANFNTATELLPHIMLKHLSWDVQMNESKSHMMGSASNCYPDSFSGNSRISINFSPFSSFAQPERLPALPHHENSSGWEINLDSLLSRQSGSRFAVQALLIGDDSEISKVRSKSIDDEYAPAVFTMEKIQWSDPTNSKELGARAFHQWRAVAYSSAKHDHSMATDVKTTNMITLNKTSDSYEDIQNNRLLIAYFGNKKLSSLPVKSVVISFGQSQDGFYSATNYTSWTSTIGFGTPPADEFSTLIICMLFVGVGCPLIVIVLGGIYVTYVRFKRRKSGLKKQLITNYDYEPIET